jgi:hypothetical protein
MNLPASSLHDRRGSLWNRWDLHFHTPSSFDYANTAVTDQEIVDGLIQNGVRVVAITDPPGCLRQAANPAPGAGLHSELRFLVFDLVSRRNLQAAPGRRVSEEFMVFVLLE